ACDLYLLGRSLIQLERLVQRTHRQFHVFVSNDHRGLDFAGADHLDVDALLRKGLEHQAGYTNVRTHADAHDGDLGNLVIGNQFAGLDGGNDFAIEQFNGALELVAIDGEREV